MSYIKRYIEDVYYDLKNEDTEVVKERYSLTNEDIFEILTIMTDEDGEPL